MSGITDKLMYATKPTAVDAKYYTHTCLPVNGTSFGGGEIVRIDVPCAQYGTYLDTQNSYLKFTINNTSKNTSDANAVVNIDGSAYSFIDRQQILYSGYTLEDISDYGVLASILLDNNTSMESRMTYWHILAGTHKHTYTEAQARHGLQIAAGGSLTVYIPVLGSIVGQNIDKYLPLGQLTASDSLRLELTLAQAGVPVKTNAATDTGTFTITDVEYVAHIVKLSDDAEAMVRRSITGGKYRIHGDSFRSFNQTLSSGVNNSTVNIPVKVSSLKTMLIAHRYQTSITGKNKASVTNRTRADLTEYYIQVGSVRLPQKPIKTNDTYCAEAQIELQKALHQFSRKGISLSYMAVDWVATATSADHGAFVVGMDLESFSGKSDVLNQGMNTMSQPIHFIGTYDGLPADAIVTTFCHFDQILEIEVGTGLAKVMF